VTSESDNSRQVLSWSGPARHTVECDGGRNPSGKYEQCTEITAKHSINGHTEKARIRMSPSGRRGSLHIQPFWQREHSI
jgi:hypothetical protein